MKMLGVVPAVAAPVRRMPLLSSYRRAYASSRQGFAFYTAVPFVDRWASIQQTLKIFGHVSEGNTVTAYRETEDSFREMWADVDRAQRQVLWQTYICKDDVVGKHTMKKLEDAHARGVETELLYDCGGNITGRTKLTERLRAMGARVIRHRPFFEYLWTYVRSGLRWDLSPAIRNHRKILVVDAKVGYAGGLNIGDDYCGKILGGNGRFRDTHCRVVGPAVQHLLDAYEDTKKPRPWKYSFKRWRQVVRNVVLLRRQHGRMLEALRRGESAVRKLRSFSNRVVARLRQVAVSAEEKCGDAIRGIGQQRPGVLEDGLAHGTALGSTTHSSPPFFARQRRHRWVQQQLRKANRVASRLKKDGRTSARAAMERRMEAVRRHAQELLERQRHQFELRRTTRANLAAALADTEPVPESTTIHSTIAPFTQIISANPHTRDWSIQFALWHVTKHVHRRLWITTPYYMPHRKLTRALLLAARRGVDVRIMAGSRTTTDPWFMWHASRHLSERFLRAGVRIYEYNGGQIMHAKTTVADSVWSCVGSYNWDIMSNKNMEVCVTHFGTDLAREMERQFLQDVALSHELTLETFHSISLPHRMVACLAYYMLRVLEKVTFFTYEDPDLMSELD